MKKLIACLFLMSLNVYANLNPFPMIFISNFSGNYVEDRGQASASRFVFTNINFGQNPRFIVEKNANVLSFKTPLQEYHWENAPRFIENIDMANWNALNLDMQEERVKFEISSAVGKMGDKNLDLKKVSLDCNARTGDNDFFNKLLFACLSHQGKFAAESLYIGEGVGNPIRNINVDIKNDRLNFTLKTSVTVVGDGVVEFNPNLKEIKIRIDRAKTGILNIKGRFFAEIKKFESDNIIVENPYIYIRY